MKRYRVTFWKWQRVAYKADVFARTMAEAVRKAEAAEPAYKGWLESADQVEWTGQRIEIRRIPEDLQ